MLSKNDRPRIGRLLFVRCLLDKHTNKKRFYSWRMNTSCKHTLNTENCIYWANWLAEICAHAVSLNTTEKTWMSEWTKYPPKCVSHSKMRIGTVEACDLFVLHLHYVTTTAKINKHSVHTPWLSNICKSRYCYIYVNVCVCMYCCTYCFIDSDHWCNSFTLITNVVQCNDCTRNDTNTHTPSIS